MHNEKEVQGIWWPETMPDELIKILLECRAKNIRVVLDYGNTETGESWGDTYGTTGYIGKSTGIRPCALLVYNRRSIGGGALLSSIVSVKTSKGKRLLWSCLQK